MQHKTWLIGLAVGFVAMMGLHCQRDTTWNDPGPRAVFRQYLMHWFHQEREAAFEMIAPEDRAALTRPLDGLETSLDSESLPAPHEMLVAGRTDNPYDIRSMEVTPSLDSRPEPGETVTLTLDYHDGRTGRAHLVWREDRWYVDLPMEASGHTSTSDEPSPSTDSTSESGDTP